MKEYPATKQSFKVNDKTFFMRKLTLGMQADIEDENIEVTIKDVILNSTNMSEEDVLNLDVEQFHSIYNDINAFTYTSESGGGEPKKQ